MKKYILITLLVMLAAGPAGAQVKTCYAKLERDTLRIGNDRIERAFAWDGGALRTLWISDFGASSTTQDGSGSTKGRTLWPEQNRPDFALAKEAPENAVLEVVEVPEGRWSPACLIARISYNIGRVQVRREYRLYDGVPAIACDTYLKGVWDITPEELPILDQICMKGRNWHCTAVEFHDVTDVHNTLLEEHRFISYHHSKLWNGNLLLARDAVSGNGLFLLKEAPCSDMQVGKADGDFRTKNGRFQVVGIGFEPTDILEDEWTRLYGCVLGVTGDDALGEALALRAYQKTLRVQKDMVMMNTWGDRSQDGRVSEAFCLQELDKAARLGVTVFQIDDGWQVGKSPASVTKGGSFDNIWERAGYWDVDPVKFPHGLKPIVDKGKDLGIEIGLWFNPSVKDELADWEKDAAVLTGLWREYGIRIFKIDGLIIPTKKAERNLRSLLERVREETGDDVIFNMDVTNGRRIGYNWFAEYGNIFLENRYTDWGNYYPYKTLRNLWQLSRYVAPERFQIEFLNPWRNPDKYPDGDPFAPSGYSFDYLAAITFAAQPLAWMEASNLPEEAFATGDLLRSWYRIAHDFHAGSILPVGEEPSGRSWTGFQSVKDPKHGYLLIYREGTAKARARIKTWLPGKSWVRLRPVLGNGKSRLVRVDADGFIKVRLREPNSFALYEY
ncbi:MAG: alpha-galactosidase [Bacteroidales bacterium]|nr:alpha-galactosidase [Bacteroidales bacterium]